MSVGQSYVFTGDETSLIRQRNSTISAISSGTPTRFTGRFAASGPLCSSSFTSI